MVLGMEDVGTLDYWDIEQALAGQAMVQVRVCVGFVHTVFECPNHA